MKKNNHHCKVCKHTWKGRSTTKGKYPVSCPKCQSKQWRIGETASRLIQKHKRSLDTLAEKEISDTLDYENATNQGGMEWGYCMYFNDTEDGIIEGCSGRGDNVATLEVPLGTVDITWRDITRPAAHPSERGCYTTMPLVLCPMHFHMIVERQAKALRREQAPTG